MEHMGHMGLSFLRVSIFGVGLKENNKRTPTILGVPLPVCLDRERLFSKGSASPDKVSGACQHLWNLLYRVTECEPWTQMGVSF